MVPDPYLQHCSTADVDVMMRVHAWWLAHSSQVQHQDDTWRSLPLHASKRMMFHFCNHNEFNECKAKNHLTAVLNWRNTFKPWDHPLHLLPPTPRHGIPAAIMPGRGYENQCLVYVAGRFFLRAEVDREEHDNGLIALLEHCLFDKDGPRASSLVVIIDYDHVGLKSVDLNARRRELKILKSYYPDCISRLILMNHPIWLQGVWALVSQWYDKKTVQRVRFLKSGEPLTAELRALFPQAELAQRFGGSRHTGAIQLLTGQTLDNNDVNAIRKDGAH